MTDRCRSCAAEIVWVKTTSGASMPCDPPIVEVIPGRTEKPTATVVTDDGRTVTGLRADAPHAWSLMDILPTATERGRVAHWATCPSAKRHRGKRRGA